MSEAIANHGAYNNYRRGCRCDLCVAAAKRAFEKNRERVRAKRAATLSGRAQPIVTHGAYSYRVLGCRCEVCCEASRQERAKKKARLKERAGAGGRKGQPWTAEEVQFLADQTQLTTVELAQLLGRTYPATERMRARVRDAEDPLALVWDGPLETCTIDGCGKPHASRGWCAMHYARWQKHGDPLIARKPREIKTCELDDCDEPHSSLGYCKTHYDKFRRHGDPEYVREPSHGYFRYKTFGCRCDVCREASAERSRRTRLSRKSRLEQAPHGTAYAYSSWECRCGDCRRAWANYRREQLARDPEALALHRERSKRRMEAQYHESTASAVKHGDVWTGPELEFVLRNDLTVAEMAGGLRRTTYAVATARRRAMVEPKYIELAGASQETA